MRHTEEEINQGTHHQKKKHQKTHQWIIKQISAVMSFLFSNTFANLISQVGYKSLIIWTVWKASVSEMYLDSQIFLNKQTKKISCKFSRT